MAFSAPVPEARSLDGDASSGAHRPAAGRFEPEPHVATELGHLSSLSFASLESVCVARAASPKMNLDQKLIAPDSCLIKYRAPIRISDKSAGPAPATATASPTAATASTSSSFLASPSDEPRQTGPDKRQAWQTKRSASLSDAQRQAKEQVLPLAAKAALLDGAASVRTLESTENILQSILPPKRFFVDAMLYIQEVSSCPASRIDVVQLTRQLDHQLESRGAKMTGICPIRRELFTQVS
ncbi:unnamed protein product [Protopolystoma xenopodis]|uniref:Uncharacterized protein n=1 Tax=Protopolystoma xenopodis TaxID=117903 RepID=A0A448X8T1_9PLAT|nr:unnamed protein product [Protopolystoma xenopodis]